MLTMGIGADHAGIDGEALTADDALGHAASDAGLEQRAQQVAVAKPAVPVLGEGRVVRHGIGQVEPAEPAMGEVQRDFLAQPPLRADAAHIADEQHADHQLGINRGPADRAVVGLQLPANARQLNKAIDRAQKVILRDVIFEAEAVEQRSLPHCPLAHHVRIPIAAAVIESGYRSNFKTDFFNGISGKRTIRFRAPDGKSGLLQKP